MDTLIGSLEPGKAADLIAMDLDTPETQPVYDVIAQVVHAGGREQFSHAWVQGQPVLAEREPATPGGRAAAIQARQAARHWHARIQASRNLTNS
jgi:5-methylthioadenosine/S-adenosylhomocysteine deaminase